MSASETSSEPISEPSSSISSIFWSAFSADFCSTCVAFFAYLETFSFFSGVGCSTFSSANG
jgi:hypothetical protein